MIRPIAPILCWLAAASGAMALEPNQVLVVVNGQIPQSVQVGRYYCSRRAVPPENLIAIALGTRPLDHISRQDYERILARTIKEYIHSLDDPAAIRCIVTTWGVPFRVAGRGPIPGTDQVVKGLRSQIERSIASGDKQGPATILQLQEMIDRLSGAQTGASVDSELSMVLFGDYELYRWQPNLFKEIPPDAPFRVLMVSRLDGPSPQIAMGLVDKALKAEKEGLTGTVCIDARGIKDGSEAARYDQSLRDLANYVKTHTQLPVRLEDTDALFAPGGCPKTAIYCGWYSLRNYVDAFDFVDGAIGFHIASFEATDLRNPNSRQWCPAMLTDGITATIGAVDEPYLAAFPMPDAFFKALFEGHCLAEAYYMTNPFNSWQMVLIGDPLFRPWPVRD